MTAMPLFSRLAAEVSLFGASTLAMFEDQVVLNLTSPQRKKLAAFYRIGADHSCSTLHFSPILQGQEESFFILLRLTELSRMDPSSAVTIELEEIENQLVSLENQHEMGHHGGAPDIAAVWAVIWRLVSTVLRIYHTILKDRLICSKSPEVITLVEKAVSLLKIVWNNVTHQMMAWELPFAALRMGPSRNIGVYTMLFITACAMDDQADLEDAVTRLFGTKEILSDNHFAKLSVVIELLLSRKRHSACSSCTATATKNCLGGHDGLDLLRRPGGPFEAIRDFGQREQDTHK